MENNWIKTSERLPDLEDKKYEFFGHKVIACWGPDANNIAQLSYVRRTIRQKIVERWEYHGRISTWPVKYWMEFPNPPIDFEN